MRTTPCPALAGSKKGSGREGQRAGGRLPWWPGSLAGIGRSEQAGGPGLRSSRGGLGDEAPQRGCKGQRPCPGGPGRGTRLRVLTALGRVGEREPQSEREAQRPAEPAAKESSSDGVRGWRTIV